MTLKTMHPISKSTTKAHQHLKNATKKITIRLINSNNYTTVGSKTIISDKLREQSLNLKIIAIIAQIIATHNITNSYTTRIPSGIKSELIIV